MDHRVATFFESMESMIKRCIIIMSLSLLLLPGTAASAAVDVLSQGQSGPGARDAAVRGEATEAHLPVDRTFTPWILDSSLFDEDQGDTVERRQVVEPDIETVKLANLVPPVHFREGDAQIPDEYLVKLRDVLDSMRDRANVRLHFIGHADSQQLSDDLAAVYGDNVGLSRERAGTTAEYCQAALHLPPEAISYEGLGDSQPLDSNTTEQGRALNRRVEVEVWYDLIGEKLVEKEVVIPRVVNRVKVCRTETVCKLRYKDGHSHRARIKNLLAPLHYDEGLLDVPESFLEQVRQARTNLRGNDNVQIKFIAYTDNTPLAGRQQRIYGNHLGLSKAVARRAALAVQDALGLPNAALASEGRGATHPVATNDTPKGRSLNRRIEIEFWHDDPLQDLPDEPQICPESAGAETVSRVYHSPSGEIPPILFEQGDPQVKAEDVTHMHRVMAELSDKDNVRLRFVGYTSNERLNRRTAAIYGDDIGWSTARAHRAMTVVRDLMDLSDSQVEFEGRGFVQSDDVVNAGFIESDISRVEIQVVYDELLTLDDYEGVEVSRLSREILTADPFSLNQMRISIDGQPLDDPNKGVRDVQRCTDLALNQAQVSFKHDSLSFEPRLNVTAWPRTISTQDLPETDFAENRVQFSLYSNYRSFINRAEVRIYTAEQSVRDLPFEVIEMDALGRAEWTPALTSVPTPGLDLKYLVRVYGKQGHFDETIPQPLWIVGQLDTRYELQNSRSELLAGYGESRIARRNIPLQGGLIKATGNAIPAGHDVWLAGHPVPVDAKGRFAAEEILPNGLHTVELAVLDDAGNGELYLRDLAIDRNDWFTVGIADLTLSANETNGPAELLSPDKPQYSDDVDVQGRLAFYTRGKFGSGWSLTASADTREGPFDEIFSNFLDKSPEALFRRIDPDHQFPTFGDDSSVEEDAPTLGKFYVKLKKDRNYGLWGNFKVGYTDNSLVHVDRGLYGANLHYQTLTTTRFGEQRLEFDGFAAEPGTVAGRDDFRGTGGSLYYLRRQDILEGSERLRIEMRDKDSGMVLGVKNLIAALDYDIDYLQGRILLTEPLKSTEADGLLVKSEATGGNPVYLVARYEFTPGFDEPDTLTAGGRAQYWLNDYIRVGATASEEDESGSENSLHGADVTLRVSTQSWIKLETGRSDGPGQLETDSLDGGFNFNPSADLGGSDVMADAWRADASLSFSDLFREGRGRLTLYNQDLEAGYSAPGLLTEKDTSLVGGTLEMPITEQLAVNVKVDKREQRQGLDTEAGELNVDYQASEHWVIGSGLRHDTREDRSLQVPLTQVEGKRTDAVLRLSYDSLGRWTGYGFAQDSLETSGNRDDNGRLGAGGGYRVNDRFRVNGEVSGGDLGTGAEVGTEYLYSDRTTLYLNYALENDRSDNGLRSRKGAVASGFRTRYSDSASVYLEERYTHGDVPTGLMHSTGVDLSPTDRLNCGASLDFGTLVDHQTAAELERTAAGISAGYGFKRLKLASALEYRRDKTEQPDTSTEKRTTWLVKNSIKYKLTPDWNLIGKVNFSHSDSSLGQFYDGDYTEAVIGYAYRPVDNDRINTLLKYTFFYNVPSADQSSGTDTMSSAIQKSHIAAIDVMYELTARWALGGKYAYRRSEVSLDRADRDFFTSRAHLYIVRADWHFVHRWDALIEGRMLELPDAQDHRSGILAGLYRHFGNHVKLGLGYNFSDFSDDLTDLDYDHQGLFVNLIGKY